MEIISIGDELLIGQTVNTNASWMGEQLMELGIAVRWITTVGDDFQCLKEALDIATTRADVVLLTGGLGPTHDDVTKKVVADFFHSKLVLDKDVLEKVKNRFAKRGLPLTKANEEQAWVPDKAELMDNDCGTAPGFIFTQGKKCIYVMPGVPQEMKSMMARFVLPRLKSQKIVPVHKKVLCTTGIAESFLYEKLSAYPELDKLVKIAYLPNYFGVRIRLTAEGKTDDEAMEKIDGAEKIIRRNISEYIYADRDILLEEAIAERMVQDRKTLAVAESCTGGFITNRFTNIPGSSNFFERGVVTYSNRAKTELLGVPAGLIERHGAVSAEVARAMAEGIRRLAKTDYSLSTTGIAGPTGGTDEKPVGLVFVACADEGKTIFEHHTFADQRLINKQRFAQAAMNLLRKRLQGLI
jgi:nicotinamide-nucleotide amidase